MGWGKNVVDERVTWLGGSTDGSLNWLYSDGAIEGHSKLKFNGILRASKRAQPDRRFVLANAQELEIADQAVGIKVLGAATWAAAGAFVAGPVGAAVAGVLGGRGETVTFLAKFAAGETMLGQVPKRTWLKMLAARV